MEHILYAFRKFHDRLRLKKNVINFFFRKKVNAFRAKFFGDSIRNKSKC